MQLITRPRREASADPSDKVDPASMRSEALRCLIIGHHDGLPSADTLDPGRDPDEERISWTQDPQDDFDLIFATSPADSIDFTSFLATASNPVAPLIAIDHSFGRRADRTLRGNERDELTKAFMELAGMSGRVSALSPLPVGRERPGLYTLAMMHTRNRALSPVWSPASPLSMVYEELLGVPDAHRVLQHLHDLDLVSRQFRERLHICSHCDSSRLHAREVCVRCASSNLEEQVLVHHYRCSHQAALAEFECEEGLRCPKCRRSLRHYGVDYDKPGQIASCLDCELPMSEPTVGFVCADCGESTAGDDAAHRCWYEYELLPDALNVLRTGALDGVRNRLNRSEFARSARNCLEVAVRCDRPLSAVEVRLLAQVNPSPPESRQEAAAFLASVIAENARRGDLITTISDGSLVILPETDAIGARQLLERMEQRLRGVLHPTLGIESRVVVRNDLADLLKALI